MGIDLRKDVWVDLFITICIFVMMVLNFRNPVVFFQAGVLCLLMVLGIFLKIHRQNQRVAAFRAAHGG